MCVIILRHPGIEIPFHKIQSACIVNPDGWGLAVADRGKLAITKGLETKTDPEQIAKFLDDAKNQSVMLHLRYVTSGERVLENCHPWLFLEYEKHGIDAAFCHNGTLYTWKESDSKRPDSWHINEQLVKPLYERVLAFTGTENVLKDEFAINILEQTAGSNSLFGLIDGNGVQLAINHASGKEFDGWWASNEYSFNRSHREPTSSYSSTTTTYGDGVIWSYEDANNETFACSAAQDNGPVEDPPDEEDGFTLADEEDLAEEEELLEQCEKIKETMDSMKSKRMNPKLIKACLSEKRPTFVELTKITDLREITRFDPEDLCELAVFYPEATAVLLQDLLAALYFKGLVANRAAKTQEALAA